MRPMVSALKSGSLLDRAFVVGIVLKGLDGVLELLGGVLLFIVTPTTINSLARWATQHELSEDPHDFLATHLLHYTGRLTGNAMHFGGAYLLLHGAVKIVLVAAVLKNYLWAYPLMILFLLVFIAYQVYRLTFAPSAGLVGLTVFDLAVTWLTWREYVRQRGLRRGRAVTGSVP